MADLQEQDPQTPGHGDEQAAANAAAALGADSTRGNKRRAPDDDDDDDEKPGRERRKIDIKFISDKSRRHITFSKRKAGIMKKVRANCRRDARVWMRNTMHPTRATRFVHVLPSAD